MIEFLYHDGIQKEIAAIERRFKHLRQGLTAFERLCEWQWFAVKGAVIVFLCIATHIDNYSEEKMNQLAYQRVGSVF